MKLRFTLTLVACFTFAYSAAAQVVRFETTQGDFDMVLNPTRNPLLQGNVDNMLNYVENNNYLGSWINRAQSGFVLQMGGFFSHTKRAPITIDSIHSVQTFDPVEGAPAATIPGLSNTVGTVALALPSDNNGPLIDAGTSSFFVNIGDNAGLDTGFTVFAMIPDMTTVNKIMALTTIDRTTDPVFGAGSGNLGFSDVPVDANGLQVFIKRAFVISDAMTIAVDNSNIQSVLAASTAAAANSSSADLPPLTSSATLQSAASSGGAAVGGGSSLNSSVVPEPASCVLAALGALVFGLSRRRR